ncbi:MAG: galactokinase family protein [Thermoproteota archaeon]
MIHKKYFEEAEKILGAKPKFVASAPGGVDLFNTHQDYKGLPVVAAAVNLRTYVYAVPLNEEKIKISTTESLSGNKEIVEYEIDLKDTSKKEKNYIEYLAAIIRVLKRMEKESAKINGLKIYIRSDTPISQDISGSGTLEVSSMMLLNGIFNLGLDKKRIAEYSFLAESYEVGTLCGRIEQYTSTFGGIVVLRQKPTIEVEEISRFPLTLVVINSGETRPVDSIRSERENEINEGLQLLLESPMLHKTFKKKLGKTSYEVDWEKISKQELMKYLFLIPETSAKRFLFTIDMNVSTQIAISILKGDEINIAKLKEMFDEERIRKLEKMNWNPEVVLGEIMNYQHEILRDSYEMSTEKIEKIRNYILAFSPVLGIKVSSKKAINNLIALVRNKEEANNVVNEALEAGATSATVVEVDKGVEFYSF